MRRLDIYAFVISTLDYGESDLIVSLFSYDHGKIRAIAKGAKRSKHRFVNCLEPFSLIKATVILPKTQGLCMLESACLKKSFSTIPLNPVGFTHACLAGELLELWTKPMDPNQNIFDLYLWILDRIGNSDPEHYARFNLFFQTKILAMSGYSPDWDKCLICATQNKKLHVPLLGLASGDCRICQNHIEPKVSVGTLKTLANVIRWSPKQLMRLNVIRNTLIEGWSIMVELNTRHLGKYPKSYNVLKSLDTTISSAIYNPKKRYSNNIT